jgi:FAD binding domain.
VNEACNYSDFGQTFFDWDANRHEFANIPYYLIFDHKFKTKYVFITQPPGEECPDWLTRANTLEELAQRPGINKEDLLQTVERFNFFAKEGKDPDFHGGESAYDRYFGDPEWKPNPCLGPIDTPPYYGIAVLPSALGTNGGLKTNENAQVLNWDEDVILGLYACGNTMASIYGNAYLGLGSTIGQALTFGYIAAKHILGEKS